MPAIAVDRNDRVASDGECADPTLMLLTERPTAGEGGSEPLIWKRTSWFKRAEKTNANHRHNSPTGTTIRALSTLPTWCAVIAAVDRFRFPGY
jgi:hypothetical protein